MTDLMRVCMELRDKGQSYCVTNLKDGYYLVETFFTNVGQSWLFDNNCNLVSSPDDLL